MSVGTSMSILDPCLNVCLHSIILLNDMARLRTISVHGFPASMVAGDKPKSENKDLRSHHVHCYPGTRFYL